MSTALYQRLAATVGERNVLTSARDIAPYCRDLLDVHHGRPRCVVCPSTTLEVAEAVAACAAANAPMVACGGNTGFSGGSIPDASGTQVVIALARMNRIRSIDVAGGAIAVDAGCVLAQVREQATAQGRLLPLSHGGEGSSQIGGNLATNAGGLNVLRYGMARELVLGLEVVLANGRVLDRMRSLRAWMVVNAENAAAWVEQIADPQRRFALVPKVVESWSRRDPAAAQAWAQRMGVAISPGR